MENKRRGRGISVKKLEEINKSIIIPCCNNCAHEKGSDICFGCYHNLNTQNNWKPIENVKYRAYSTDDKTYIEIISTCQCVAQFCDNSFEIFDDDSNLLSSNVGIWNSVTWHLFQSKVKKHLNFIIGTKHKPRRFINEK